MNSKRIIFFTFFVALVVTNVLAKTAIVDGVGGATDRFAKISDAVAATTYDTIRVLSGIYSEASTITIDRKVVLIGNGYRNVANGGTHVLNSITFSTNAAGSRIIGFKFPSGGIIQVSTDGVTVANNYITGTGSYIQIAGNNDTVRNNIIITPTYGVYISGGNGYVICNNIFKGITYAIWQQTVSTNAIVVLNNFFDACQYMYYQYQNISAGLTGTGNILYKGSYISIGSTPGVLYAGNLHYNMAAGYKTSGFPGVVADNTEGDPSFKNFSTSSGFVFNDDLSNDTDLRLLSGTSVAVDIGYPAQAPLTTSYIDYHPSFTFGGARSDAGIYGGPWTFPFPSGGPVLPSVTSISVSPSVVAPGGTINLNVSGSVGGFTGRGN